MRLILVDTGVVSRYIMQKPSFVEAIDIIGFDRIAISAITKIELFHWVNGYKSQLGEKAYKYTLREINKFPTVQIDRKVSAIAVDLAQRYFTKVGDLLIASIAIHNEIEIFTVNTKDFKAIKGVNLYTPSNYLEIRESL